MSDNTKKSIICDECNLELTEETNNPAKYVFELTSINVGVNTSCFINDVIIPKPIKNTLHFCDIKCLKKWVKNK